MTFLRVRLHLLKCALGASLLLCGCTSRDPDPTSGTPQQELEAKPVPDSTEAAGDSSSVTPPDRKPLPVLGVVPDFVLTDQTGAEFPSVSLWGRVWVANFIFTRCTATCPQQTARLAALAREFRDDLEADRVEFVSFTVDPAHDTPEVLARYAASHGAEPASWHFATGDRDSLWELSRDGFKLPVKADSRNTDNPFFHSSQFVLIDQQGRIRGYYDGVSAEDVARLKRHIARVVAEMKAVPPGILARDQLDARRKAQLEAVAKAEVFHDFAFRDALPESGIRFRNQIVGDAEKQYKACHYDHGNGLAAADVDGDGLVDLYFVSQLGGNELWRNLGGGRFENMTERAAVAVPGRIGVTATFADIDNDGDPDLYVTTVRGGNVLFENDGAGKFRDITAESGLGYDGHSSGAVFFDYDKDGKLDLFLCNVGVYTTEEKAPEGYYIAHPDAFAGHLKPDERNERSLLFRNEGGNRFKDVTEETGLIDESWTGDATPLDANQDGWPDLYVLNMQGHNEYYENVEGKKFVKRSRELFPKTPWGAMGVKVFDFDNDGRLDLYLTDMHSDMSQEVGPDKEKLKAEMKWPESMLQTGGNSIFGNALFRSTAPNQYEELSDRVGAENYWPWGLSVGDLNADGWDDAFIASSMNFPFRYGVNSLLLNERGRRFVDAEFALGVEPRRGHRTAIPWFELDCSGADKGHLDCKARDGRVAVWGTLGSRSSAILDIDNDGDLDIVTNDFNSEPMVLVSNLTEKRPVNRLQLTLEGTKSNRSGIGAVVTVKSGGLTQTKVHDGKSGYLSQSDMPLYFGLGDAESAESIEVAWPSGTKQTIAGPIRSGAMIVKEE